MKKLIVILALFSSIPSFGQDMKAIEKELLESFRQIDSFKQLEYMISMAGYNYYGDSAETANDRFAKKLVYYTSVYSKTLDYDFQDLQKAGISIASSADLKFRIYSWDKEQGGTEHFFENVIQFQGDKLQSVRFRNTMDSESDDDDTPECYHSEIIKPDITIPGIYLACFHVTESSKYSYEGIRCFKIENNDLIDTFQIFKTDEGMSNEMGLEFDWGKTKREDVPDKLFYWSDHGKTITIPFVNDMEKVSPSSYHFNVKYYEKVLKK